MSEPRIVPTFIAAEEDGDTMTITYRSETGELGRFAFGRSDSPLAFQAVLVGFPVEGIYPDNKVEVYLRKRDAPGVTILSNIKVTHLFRVALDSHDEAVLLAKQAADFMRSAA